MAWKHMGTMKRLLFIGFLLLAIVFGFVAFVMRPGSHLVRNREDTIMTNIPSIGGVELTERQLIQSYAAASNSHDKMRIGNAFAQKGGDDAFVFLTNVLLGEYSGKKVTENEELYLTHSIKVIGFLGRRSDAAYEFAIAGTDPGFWLRQSLWVSPQSTDVRDFLLVGNSALALGLSGRPDAIQRIHQLAQTSSAEYRSKWSGSIVTAAYYDAMIKKMGVDRFLDEVFMRERTMEEYDAWSRTDDGRRWNEWLNSNKQ